MNDEQLDLQKAVDRLKHQSAYDFVVNEINAISESLIDELPEVPSDKLQMHSGRITTYREVLTILRGE